VTDLGWPELLIVAAIAMLLFGTKKMPDMARSIGRSMRIVKAELSGLHEDEPAPAPVAATSTAAQSAAPSGPASEPASAAPASGPAIAPVVAPAAGPVVAPVAGPVVAPVAGPAAAGRPESGGEPAGPVDPPTR
jgi:sec-independent protein translocase protein TatA